jgi:hypothetical protein
MVEQMNNAVDVMQALQIVNLARKGLPIVILNETKNQHDGYATMRIDIQTSSSPSVQVTSLD